MKNHNIPKLRYPEFTDAWEKCKLGEVIINHSSSNYIQEAKAFGEFEVIQQGNTPIVGYSNEMPFENFENVLCFGDHTTSLYKPLTPFLLATDGVKILSIKGVQGYFILSFFERYKPNAEGYKRHFSILKKQQGYIPPLPEQQKIGNLFKQLDHLITLHKRKWDDVILLKKALLQKMFPKNGADFPEIRFPEFTDAWEKCKFKNFFNKSISNNTLSRSELTLKEGMIHNIHYGDILIKYGSIVDLNNDKDIIPYISNAREEDYVDKFLRNGDIVIADTAEDNSVGKAIEIINLDNKPIVAGLHTMAFRSQTRIAPYFMGYYLNSNSYRSQLRKLFQGIKVLSISKSNISETFISYPRNKSEQQKIGNLFKQLDRLITLHKRQHEHYQLLKKALLQQMFV